MMGASYPTKTELKLNIGQQLRYVETSPFGAEYPANGTGTVTVVGPDPYRNRKWYATVTLENDVIVSVR